MAHVNRSVLTALLSALVGLNQTPSDSDTRLLGHAGTRACELIDVCQSRVDQFSPEITGSYSAALGSPTGACGQPHHGSCGALSFILRRMCRLLASGVKSTLRPCLNRRRGCHFCQASTKLKVATQVKLTVNRR